MKAPAPQGGPVRVRLLGRPGCHLCEEAQADLTGLLEEFPGAVLEIVNIETDDELHRRHLERIPVVEVNGVEICVVFFEADAVREALAPGQIP